MSPPMDLDEKLAALRSQIIGGWDEDALGHLFDLIAALHLRASKLRDDEITDHGRCSLGFLKPNKAGAPGKRTYVVIASIVRNGRNMNVGDEFEASPVGVHVRRWLAEGRIEAR